MTPSDWAAWTQAGAAIIALAVAVGVPIWQRKREDATRRADTVRRNHEEKERLANTRVDLASALYHELSHHVARCCFDFESPWNGYAKSPKDLVRFTVLKFLPEPPIVYTANADKLILLGEGPAAALMAFYFRISVVRRDIMNSVEEMGAANVKANYVQMIGTRFARTLRPGMEALEVLSPQVPNASYIEQLALKAVSEGMPDRAVGLLRERLAAAMLDADKVR